MDWLRCEFSPIVYAELYRLLSKRRDYAEPLEFRLGAINYSIDWLEEATDAYEAKWTHDLRYLTADSIADFALTQPAHAELATWLLAGLSTRGSCYDLSSDLATAVLERASRDVPGLRSPLPASLSPAIYGWTLGRIVGDEELPAAPATLPSDENARKAFVGFMQHVLLLQTMATPWPEMMTTATYWRGYGIAEALLPEHGNGGMALRQLINEASRSMASSMYSNLSRYFQPFNSLRQAVSHIADDDSRPRFVEVADAIQEWPDLRMAVVGLTQFVFQEVAKELSETPPRSVRPGVWDTLLHELATDW